MIKLNITRDVESRRRIAERRPALPLRQNTNTHTHAPSTATQGSEDNTVDVEPASPLSGRRKTKGNL